MWWDTSWTFFLETLWTQTMFSVLVFMCRNPGDATSKVSCCVETSYWFKNRDFDAIVKEPVALPLKISLPKNKTTVILKVPLLSYLYFYTKVWLIFNHKLSLVAFWREFHFNIHVLIAIYQAPCHGAPVININLCNAVRNCHTQSTVSVSWFYSGWFRSVGCCCRQKVSHSVSCVEQTAQWHCRATG